MLATWWLSILGLRQTLISLPEDVSGRDMMVLERTYSGSSLVWRIKSMTTLARETVYFTSLGQSDTVHHTEIHYFKHSSLFHAALLFSLRSTLSIFLCPAFFSSKGDEALSDATVDVSARDSDIES